MKRISKKLAVMPGNLVADIIVFIEEMSSDSIALHGKALFRLHLHWRHDGRESRNQGIRGRGWLETGEKRALKSG